MKHLTQFSHTGTLEIYHALYNDWTPKSQNFSYLGIVMRRQLPVLDFNSSSGLEQARTKSGKKKYNVGFSKITKTWSSKPIKVKVKKIIPISKKWYKKQLNEQHPKPHFRFQ